MKKILILVIPLIIIVMSGCQLGNTPTSRVEELLSKYQRLDSDIDITYVSLSGDENISSTQKEKYNDLIRKQYKNLTYEIKDEKIDGDSATITTEIEVKNYKDIINKYDSSSISSDEYHNQVINALESAKDKITYTIDFNVSLKDKKWVVDEVDDTVKLKLLGLY